MATNSISFAGVQIQMESAPASGTFNTVGEVTEFDGPGGQVSFIDVTHAQSNRVEKLLALPDEGQMSLTVNLVPGDSVQRQLYAARDARSLDNFKVILTDVAANELDFAAFTSGFSISGAQNDSISADIVLEISGKVAGLGVT